MNVVKRSEAIRSGLQKGFQNGTSKLTRRKCFGYDVGPDGELIINSDEAAVVRRIFDQYLGGSSLGAIAAALERKDVLSPTGRLEWNRETLNKLLSNEKYTGRVLLRKTISAGGSQIKNDGLMDRYLYTGFHESIISDEIFQAVQRKKLSRAKNSKSMVAVNLTLSANCKQRTVCESKSD